MNTEIKRRIDVSVDGWTDGSDNAVGMKLILVVLAISSILAVGCLVATYI